MPRKLLAAFILLVIALMAVLIVVPRKSMAQFPVVTPPVGGTQFPFITATIDPFITPTIAPTPTPPLTPAPTSAAPGCTEPFPVQVGGTITIRSGVSFRSQPSVSAPLLNVFQEPRNFFVLDGPVCNENYFWWQVEGHGLTGWVAQSSNTIPFITYIRAPGLPCAPALPIVTGQLVELGYYVRIRAEPSLSGRVLTVAPYQSRVLFLDSEALCVDGHNWRPVQVVVLGILYQGWMAEGSRGIPNTAYIVQPTQDPSQICLPPMRLEIGERGRVRYRDGTPKNLRAAPGLNSAVLYTLVENVPFEIIGGPICADGMNYWQVRVLSTFPVVGWLAEGGRGNYWIGSFD